jgi:allantoate deiminase
MTGLSDVVEQVLQRIDILATFSEAPNRLTRQVLTPTMRQAADQVSEWMRAAGMTVRRDTIGNIIGHYPGTRPGARSLLLGSHIDTVRDAGKYDGPLGVIIAIACVEALHKQGRHLSFPITVIAFADEEGLRYNSAYIGSKVIAGTFDPLTLERRDADGVSIADAIRAAGGDPAQLANERLQPEEVFAYCEVHIEQGPVLEAQNLPVGIVTSIAGQSRILMHYIGLAGHAGTVPMALRHDALSAAAAFVLATEAVARAQEGLLATVGQLHVSPGASNVIPGSVSLSVDVRHQNDVIRQTACRQLEQIALAIGNERRLTVSWELVQENPAVACDTYLRSLFTRAVAALGYSPYDLMSGAGHDAVAMSVLTSVSMLFVRCAGGISHHPAEAVHSDDVGVATATLGRFIDLLNEEQETGGPYGNEHIAL